LKVHKFTDIGRRKFYQFVFHRNKIQSELKLGPIMYFYTNKILFLTRKCWICLLGAHKCGSAKSGCIICYIYTYASIYY